MGTNNQRENGTLKKTKQEMIKERYEFGFVHHNRQIFTCWVVMKKSRHLGMAAIVGQR
jgi:hypothetical protein